MKRISLSILLFSAALQAQPSDTPRFEVASIKPSNADPRSGGVSSRSGLLRSVNVTLKRSIMGAYAIGPNQIAGGPDWLDTERFDITAKAGQPLGDHDLMVMLQSLLAERFKLAIHREMKTTQVYVMEAAKNVKLEKDDGGNSSTENGRGDLVVRNASMDRFAEVLSRQTDFPVVNRTGLDGVFKLELKWSLDSAKGDGPSLYTAIQEQLGLRLRAQKIPIEVLVIDHAERPTEN
jgi:uncharacterized protein (TIGR03435 family)